MKPTAGQQLPDRRAPKAPEPRRQAAEGCRIKGECLEPDRSDPPFTLSLTSTGGRGKHQGSVLRLHPVYHPHPAQEAWKYGEIQ